MDLFSAEPGSSSSAQRIKLRSMYAESPDDCLIFQVCCFTASYPFYGLLLISLPSLQLSDDGPELLGTDFAEKLDSMLIDQYLHRANSIPAFLSSITLQLFENQTMI